jgi:hypothetical protein
MKQERALLESSLLKELVVKLKHQGEQSGATRKIWHDDQENKISQESLGSIKYNVDRNYISLQNGYFSEEFESCQGETIKAHELNNLYLYQEITPCSPKSKAFLK